MEAKPGYILKEDNTITFERLYVYFRIIDSILHI